jgi:hypothetical protein
VEAEAKAKEGLTDFPEFRGFTDFPYYTGLPALPVLLVQPALPTSPVLPTFEAYEQSFLYRRIEVAWHVA